MNAHDCRKLFREKRKNGQIEVPSNCSKCSRDDLPIKPFFENYDKPEQITWLCTECFKTFHKARPNHFKGKKHSLESRLSMSVSHEGMIVSEKTKQKIRRTITRKGKKDPIFEIKREAKIIPNENSVHDEGDSGLLALFRRYNSYKSERKKFSLTLEEFRILTQSNCYYCGSEPKQVSYRYKGLGYGAYIYNGLDRINSDLGYFKENVVPCCKICNSMKLRLSQEDFVKHVQKIVNNFINH